VTSVCVESLSSVTRRWNVSWNDGRFDTLRNS